MKTEIEETPAADTVMIVDDEPENLNVLDAALAHTGYRMLFFTCGERALEAARRELPGVVLLDVRMPRMNGYDVCRRFKADTRLRDIPILFLSALSSSEDITQGFLCGAVDYIAKPFREAEIVARVKTHLTLSRAHSKLTAQHQRLLALERQRDAYVHMLVHDMRSPLMALNGHLQLIGAQQDANLSAADRANLTDAMNSARMLGRMVSTVIDISRMENAAMPLQLQRTTVGSLFSAARKQVLDPSIPRKVSERIPAGCPQVVCDAELTVRIIGNLLDNAVKFSPAESEVELGAVADAAGVRLWVQDSGPGIDSAYQEAIFTMFAVAECTPQPCVPSTGIGLAFCKLAVKLQGGRIGVESQSGCGSNFWFTLPAAPQTRHAPPGARQAIRQTERSG